MDSVFYKEIPTKVAMRTKQQVAKYCPPAYAGMTYKANASTQKKHPARLGAGCNFSREDEAKLQLN